MSAKTLPTRGNHLCVAIMAACRDEPSTAQQLAQRFGQKRDTVMHWLVGLNRVGVLRVLEWVPCEAGKGKRAAVYALVPGESAPPPVPRKVRRCSMVNVAALGAMWEQLQGEPASQVELCEASGMAVGTVRRLLTAMRAARLVRLAAWAPRVGCGGTPTPLYRAGAGADVPRPVPKKPSELAKAYYWRKKTAGHQARALLRATAANLDAHEVAA